MSVLLGTGTGTFQAPAAIALGTMLALKVTSAVTGMLRNFGTSIGTGLEAIEAREPSVGTLAVEAVRRGKAPDRIDPDRLQSERDLRVMRHRLLAMQIAEQRARPRLYDDARRVSVLLDPGADREQVRRDLLALPGIGPWTVEYIAMRALGDPDAYPASDLGVLHALRALGAEADARESERCSQAWRPFRSYSLMHLWGSLERPAA